MEELNMTALLECYVKAMHFKQSENRIFSDSLAGEILGRKDSIALEGYLSDFIERLYPSSENSEGGTLRRRIERLFYPVVLARSAFAQRCAQNASTRSMEQFVLLNCGYDSFAYSFPTELKNARIYELDRKALIADKIRRLDEAGISHDNVTYLSCGLSDMEKKLKESGYQPQKHCMCIMRSLCYECGEDKLSYIFGKLGEILSPESSVVFDYPNAISTDTQDPIKYAHERLKASYTYRFIEQVLSENGFLIYEHLDGQEMTREFFAKYNSQHPHSALTAPQSVSYCLAVKKPLR